jgi:hypothetical protein
MSILEGFTQQQDRQMDEMFIFVADGKEATDDKPKPSFMRGKQNDSVIVPGFHLGRIRRLVSHLLRKWMFEAFRE